MNKRNSSSQKKDKFNIRLTKVYKRKQSLFNYQWPLNNPDSVYYSSHHSFKRNNMSISVQVTNLKVRNFSLF